MAEELFDSAVRSRGDLAGVFEYDGETAYFYLYDVTREQEHRIVDAIHVLSGESDLTAQDVEVRWDTMKAASHFSCVKRSGLFSM